MFKAQHRLTGQHIVILASYWRARLDDLRRLDEADALLCPACGHPVRVRAGQMKRWHFAHKHLQNCPFERQSPELLACRAALYDLLSARFGEGSVTTEYVVEGICLPRPLDGWVEGGNRCFAYWIFDRRTPPQERQQVLEACEALQAGATPRTVFHYLFDIHLLTQDIQGPKQLVLTTTERDFMQTTLYDRSLVGSSGPVSATLHYLDPQAEELVSYRGLRLVHRPQIYTGIRLSSPLSEVQVSPQTGALFHLQEAATAGTYQEENDRQQRQLQAARRIFRQQLQPHGRQVPPPLVRNAEQTSEEPPSDSSTLSPQPVEQAEQAVCMFCGQITRDWWYLDRARKMCKCRPCLRCGRA
jgi:hypothetical protein